MKTILGLGKYVFAVPFLVFGLFHFMAADQMASMAPGGKMMVYFSGITMVAASLAIILGKYDKLASVLLAVQVLLYIVLVHIPGMSAEDEGMKQMATTSALKDFIIMGGALLCASQAKDKSIIG
ncbi:MAG: DoxX family protein [Saprospiraceae bacterium]|nr:DoxX family protein [Saprospiraceae bacterium]